MKENKQLTKESSPVADPAEAVEDGVGRPLSSRCCIVAALLLCVWAAGNINEISTMNVDHGLCGTPWKIFISSNLVMLTKTNLHTNLSQN